MADDSTMKWVTEWERPFERHLIVMQRAGITYRVTLYGFRGYGTTQQIAIDDLLAHMRRYSETSDDLIQSLAPGGELHEKLRQLDVLVDKFVQNRENEG